MTKFLLRTNIRTTSNTPKIFYSCFPFYFLYFSSLLDSIVKKDLSQILLLNQPISWKLGNDSPNLFNILPQQEIDLHTTLKHVEVLCPVL